MEGSIQDSATRIQDSGFRIQQPEAETETETETVILFGGFVRSEGQEGA